MNSQLALTFEEKKRLGRQQEAVERFLHGSPRLWFTLEELSDATGAPIQSASARLRTARARGLRIERKRSAPSSGLWLYRYVPEGAAS